MNVSGLQQHFGNLANLLNESSAKGIAADFEAIRAGLAPFASMPVKDFSTFLLRCEEFARTGQVSAAAKAPRAPAKPKVAKPNPSEVGEDTKRLYDKAATESVGEVELTTLAAKLEKLTAQQLIDVAAGIGLTIKKSAKKPTMVPEIKRWIVDREGQRVRAGMT